MSAKRLQECCQPMKQSLWHPLTVQVVDPEPAEGEGRMLIPNDLVGSWSFCPHCGKPLEQEKGIVQESFEATIRGERGEP